MIFANRPIITLEINQLILLIIFQRLQRLLKLINLLLLLIKDDARSNIYIFMYRNNIQPWIFNFPHTFLHSLFYFNKASKDLILHSYTLSSFYLYTYL